MASKKKTMKIIVFCIEWLLVTSILGVFLGVSNSLDEISSTLTFEQLSGEVKVYRNSYGEPTIIGERIRDVLFVQGYEYARDRLFQLEFTRSVANGELARLFGDDLISSDQFLRTIGLKRSAEQLTDNLSPAVKSYVQAYVDGLNEYIRLHENNLPIEFVLLNVKPKLWTIEDSIAVQGVMSFTLAWGGVRDELRRLQVYNKTGSSGLLDIFDIQNPQVISYLSSYNESVEKLATKMEIPVYRIIKEAGLEFGTGSNNWVVSGNLTESGFPLIANDPHLALTTPGIWWKVHLIAREEGLNVDGYALPGTPFITIGHNEYVAWGVTNTRTDAVDLFYLKRNDTHYLVGNEWRKIEKITEDIPLKNGETVSFVINMTDFGPIIEMDDGEYAVKWVLNQAYKRDSILMSLYGLNFAKSIYDIHDALEYWVMPGQNFVMADVNGNIAYQYTGGIPVRKSGFGIIPHNASTGNFDWIGLVPYEDQLWIPNPSKGWFTSNNERIDTRNLMYINEAYAPDYRARSIQRLISSKSTLTLLDMQDFQMDTYNMAKEDFLDPVINELKTAPYPNYSSEFMNKVFDYLENFDGYMNRDSVGATIFSIFHQFFVDSTLADELGDEIASEINYMAHQKVGMWVVGDKSNVWFDDITTPNIVEDADLIAVRALNRTLNYLISIGGADIDSWKWGRFHQVTFSHRMGVVLDFLNTGPTSSDGSKFSLNNGGGPMWNGGKPDFRQDWGASMRFVASVEPTWSNVYGILPVGSSGNIISNHYRDQFDDWLEGNYHSWTFDASKVESSWTLTAIFRGEK